MTRSTRTTIAQTLTAASAALLLACGGQQTAPVAEMTPAPAATPPLTAAQNATQPVEPLTKVGVTAKAGALDPMQLRVEQSVTRAKSAIEDARAVGADLYASQMLQTAIDQMRTAEQWRASGRVLDAIAQADRSTNSAIAAHTQAKPQHVIAHAKASQHTAEVSLMAEMSADVTMQPKQTAEGVMVAVNGAFLPLDEALSKAGQAKLSALSKLAAKYNTFNLVLSASSTDSESATKSLVLGQNRALNAGTYLQQMGIADARVTSGGKIGPEGRTLWVHFVRSPKAAVKKVQLTAL